MKIFCCDNTAFKFSKMILDYWIAKGHEVKWEIGMNPELMAWSDLTYIDFLDSNFYCAFNGPKGDHEALDWQPYPKKRIAVRGIDIDLWMGRHCDSRIWNYMDDFIVINQKLYDKVQREGNPPKGKMHLIKPGVDLEKFTFREKERGFNICMVTGDFWEMKAVNEGYRIFDLLTRYAPQYPWKLHVRGQYRCREMEQIMKEHVIDSMGIRDKVMVYPTVPDMNTWLEPMDYILVPSYKEAFSYATAEAMAKGIKPVINDFWGSTDIWPEKYIYSHFDEALEMFVSEDYDPQAYRAYVQTYYDFKDMMKQYDELLGT